LIADGHAFFDDAFHAPQTNTKLVLDQFANGFHAAVAQVINIIRGADAVVDLDHMADQAHDVVLGNGPMYDRNSIFQVELLV